MMHTADSEEWYEGDWIMLLGLKLAAVIYCSNDFHSFIPTAIAGLVTFRAGRNLGIHLDPEKYRDPPTFTSNPKAHDGSP